MFKRIRYILIGAFVPALLSSCAAQPTIRTNSAPSVNLAAYNTFGFPEQTGTDRGGYSTLVTEYFKSAVRQQMEMRGYRYVDANPELLVNFFANVHERTEVYSQPSFSMAYGYYGYRYGMYNAWPLYTNELNTMTYPVGTANVDIVDASKRQLVWEGIAKGRVSDAQMSNPQPAIAQVVSQIFDRFPGTHAAQDANARS